MKNNFEQLLKNLYPNLFKDVEDKDILNYITAVVKDRAYLSRSESKIQDSKEINGVQYILYENGDVRQVKDFEKNGVQFRANKHGVKKYGVVTSKITDLGKADFLSTFECISIENSERDENEPRQAVELYPNGNVFVINGPKNAVYYKVDGNNIERTEIDYQVELAKRAVFNDEQRFMGKDADKKALEAYRAIVLAGPTDIVPVETENRKLVPFVTTTTSSKKSGCAPWVASLLVTGLVAGTIATGVYFADKNNDKDEPVDTNDTSTSDTTSPEETTDSNNAIVTPPADTEKEEETTGPIETEKVVETFDIRNYVENEKKVVDIITEVTAQGKEITSVFFEDEKLGDTYVFRTFADGSYDLLAQEGNSGYQVIFEGSDGVVKNTKFDKNGMTIQMDIFTMNFNAKTGEQTITDPLGNILTYDETTIAGIPYGAIEEFVMDNPEEFAELIG